MRISVDKRDKGYRYDIDLNRVKVYLDGQPFTRAVTADEEEGLIIAYKLGEDGKYSINPERTGWLLEQIRGKVKIEVAADDGGSLRTPKVKVERVSEGIQVMVYSRLHPGQIRRHKLPYSLISGMSEAQLAQACGVGAGAGAEHLCEKQGDLFDPSLAAQAGVTACEELLAREAKSIRH